ncbi:MAG: hypothetical protein NT040_01230 [Bacteroidetes bacterium]|nr:hypothetical protein [Bacteroidota bacterium]
MTKKISLAVAVLMICSMAGAQDLNLDNILSDHSKAIGLGNLRKVNTITMTGTIIQQDAMPVKIIKMRPDKYLMEFDIQDITGFQGYDGQTAWTTAPWSGNPKPQVMPDDRAKELRSRADFDGLLYHWKEKGHLVELVGRDTVEKTPAFKLKVTKKDGGIEYYYMDAIKSTILKRAYSRMVRGQEVAVENYFKDYRMVQGVLFAFTQVTYFGGQLYNTLQFDTIQLNNPVDTNAFRMPVQ